MKHRKIALIGMMGSGKTTIAKVLADKINVNFIDMDELFEKKFNTSISNFFKEFSQEKFRNIETNILKDISEKQEFILSTGGGIILKEANRQILFNSDIYTILLDTKPETIYSRLKNDTTRPLLHVQDLKSEISKILNERMKYYTLAHKTIHTDGKPIDKIVEEIEWIL